MLHWNDNAPLTDPLQKVRAYHARPFKTLVNGSIATLTPELNQFVELHIGVQVDANKPPVAVIDASVDINVGDIIVIAE